MSDQDPKPEELSDIPAAEAEIEERDEYDLDRDVVEGVIEALQEEAPERAADLVADMHEADLADLIEQLGPRLREPLVRALSPEQIADTLPEFEEGVRDDVVEMLDPAVLAQAARELDSDDLVYLVEDLDKEDRDRVLESLDAADRVVVQQSLAYPEHSAGRLMQREVVTAPPFWTVGQMIDRMRKDKKNLPDPFYDIIVVDPAMRPIGKVPLSRVMGAKRPRTLESIMEDDFRTIHVEDSQEDVAYAFNKYHLVSAPVVDDSERLVGVITIDDAMDALAEEQEDDMLKLGGAGGEEEITDSVPETVRQRFPWLAVNLLTAILASLVISLFEDALSQLVALAVLMPIVASMGGNAGTQSLTVAVRGLAMRELTETNARRFVLREALAGLAQGVGFAVIMAVIAYVWFGQAQLSLVIGVAMVINLLAAALAGVLVPMALDRVGADPALASGTFVTTVTDVVGFFAFLGLASAVLL